ncbi:putative gamma-glutamyltransferase YwrD [Echria macrotheca]|uniref:Gamma-glutamyltransferase YwrD n=1 Tax=Echria macrotheca TaxID=438768 RepID=A0AAJ0BLI7_9PEZI|nr:putative gamma-glutamyltransferase YwrD [Echria macrotheca]
MASSVYPSPSAVFAKFASRRSVVHSTKGMVACTQPLAAKCGIEILEAGGNAADAAVAVAAGLNMTEPCSTGIGGDMFCLFYSSTTGTVSALNGSGRSGAAHTLSQIRSDLNLAPDGTDGAIPMTSVHSVTVPGAAAGWVDTVQRFGSGKLGLQQILGPAIRLGEEGFPVSEITAYYWQRAERTLRAASPNFAEMLKRDPRSPSGDGVRAPRAGEIIKLPNLAQTFRTLAAKGKEGFYRGRIAEEIVRVTSALGGRLTLDDLADHIDRFGGSEPVDPISLAFRGQNSSPGLRVWEHPPNGQGIVALMALGILEALETSGKIPTFSADDHNGAEYLHAVIEALRIAFADASWFVTDPSTEKVPTAGLLSPSYLAERAKLFDPNRAGHPSHGFPSTKGSPAFSSSDTVYFAVADGQGNAVSFINSNYGGFGTGIIPAGCGFTLQNRGANFSLDRNHPNRLEPRKRPYHTIIPGLVTFLGDGDDDDDKKETLHSVMGVMGGFMQPQGHVQVLLGQLVGGLNPQQALDAPRVCIGAGMPEHGDVYDVTVYVEEGMSEEAVAGLRARGHKVEVVGGFGRGLFGRGQIIRWSADPVEETGVWSAGSDLRGDGAAYPL